MKRSAGAKVDEPGKLVPDWKAESKVQPCWVKRLSRVVCVCGVSTNLEGRDRREEREGNSGGKDREERGRRMRCHSKNKLIRVVKISFR